MGWTPETLRAAYFADLRACFRGWQKSQGIDPDKRPFDRDDLEELMKWDEERMARSTHNATEEVQ